MGLRSDPNAREYKRRNGSVYRKPDGRGVDIYRLHRSWVLSDTLTEFYSVEKNNVALSADKVADFEKYILSLITPELFNLYFFDGEKIAEFFLNEGSNERIKEACTAGFENWVVR